MKTPSEPFGQMKSRSKQLMKRSYLGLRGFTLGLLQIPLLAGIAKGALTGSVPVIGVFAAASIALGCAAWLTREYFLACRASYIQTGEIKSERDRRPLALALSGFTAGLVAFSAFRAIPAAAVFTALGAAGYYLRYMLPDAAAPESSPQRVATDHLNPTLRGMIDSAYQHIDTLRDVQRRLRLKPQEHDVAMQLYSIILHSRRLIAIIAEQPERIRAARQFLVVQLPELATISHAYLENRGSEHEAVRNNFLELLRTGENALFQKKKLLDHNRFETLDTRMQVLRDQLKIKAHTHE